MRSQDQNQSARFNEQGWNDCASSVADAGAGEHCLPLSTQGLLQSFMDLCNFQKFPYEINVFLSTLGHFQP